MLQINKTKKDLESDLEKFIWDFKISDNILYNLDILYNLIDDHNNAGRRYRKPISVISVSVAEAIMIDFLYRLYGATNHFPAILKHLEKNIKEQLTDSTIKSELIGIDGKKYYHSTLKNFNFSPMLEIYKKLKLLGDNAAVYELLLSLSYFRNRIHIKNYFNNFEKDEGITFSEKRTQKTIDTMLWISDYFKNNYSRPWQKS
jgi:hypothetical protein